MILVSLISLAISGSHGSFVMVVFLVMVAGASFGLLLLARRMLSCEQRLVDGLILKGDRTRYEAEIYCRVPAFAFIKAAAMKPSRALSFGEDAKAMEREFELFGRSRVRFGYDIFATYRCVNAVGIEYIEMYDFLKIFKVRKYVEDNPILVVCPDVVPFSSELFSIAPSQEAGTSRKASFEDYSSVTDVRKYEYSDQMKRVHWKLSAKKSELMVKNYDHTNTMVTAIILDNRAIGSHVRNPELLEDSLLETTISIAKFNLDDSYPVMLDYMEDGAPMRAYEPSSAGFDRMFFSAASIRMDAELVEPLFDEYYNPNFMISALYVMSANPCQSVSKFLKHMSTTGLDVNVIHFFEDEKDELSKVYDESGVGYYGVRVKEHMKVE